MNWVKFLFGDDSNRVKYNPLGQNTNDNTTKGLSVDTNQNIIRFDLKIESNNKRGLFVDSNQNVVAVASDSTVIKMLNLNSGDITTIRIKHGIVNIDDVDALKYYSDLNNLVDDVNCIRLLMSVDHKYVAESHNIHVMFKSYLGSNVTMSSNIIRSLCDLITKTFDYNIETHSLFNCSYDDIITAILIDRNGDHVILNVTDAIDDVESFNFILDVLKSGNYRAVTKQERELIKLKEHDSSLLKQYNELITLHIKHNHTKGIVKFRPIDNIESCCDFWEFKYNCKIPNDLKIWITNKLYEDNKS